MAEEFISLLCSRLLEDGANDIDDSILQEALKESIQQLPHGTIRTALEDEFDTYYEKLRRLLSPPDEDPPSPPSSPPKTICVDVTTAIGLMATLEALGETTDWEKKQEMYVVLLLGSLKNSANLHRVLDQWSNDLKGRDLYIVLSAVQQCSAIICSSPSSLVPWLTCCLRVFPSLLATAVERGAIAKELTLISKMVVRVMTTAHINHYQDDNDGENRFYDLMSALVSIYIDTCLQLSSSRNDQLQSVSEKVINLVFTVLGHSHVHLLDAVLQVSVPSTQPEAAAMLLPVICRVLQSSRSLSPMTSLQYIKIVSCYQSGCRLQLLSSSPDNLHWVPSLLVPSNLSEWLWSTSSRVCESLALRKSWSSEKTARHLLRPLAPWQVDLLVELITMACGPLSLGLVLEEPVVDSAELFYRDSCGSFTSDVECEGITEEKEVMEDREICIGDNVTMSDCLNSSVTHTMAGDSVVAGKQDGRPDTPLRQTPSTVDGRSPDDVITYNLAGTFSVPRRPATSRRQKLLAKLARSSSASPLKSPKLISPKRLRRSTRRTKN